MSDYNVSNISSITYREVGQSTTQVDSKFIEAFSFPKRPDRKGIGSGTDKKIGSRHDVVLKLNEWSQFPTLNTLMVQRKEIEIVINWANGDTWTIAPIRFTVTPLFQEIPDGLRGHIAAAGTATSPPDAAWTDLGPLVGGNKLTCKMHSKGDDAGRPLYTQSDLAYEPAFIKDIASAISSFEGGAAVIAIEQPDGTFLKFKAQDVEYDPHVEALALDEFVEHRLRLTGADPDVLNLLTLPTTPPDYFYAMEINGMCSGYQLSDYFTAT